MYKSRQTCIHIRKQKTYSYIVHLFRMVYHIHIYVRGVIKKITVILNFFQKVFINNYLVPFKVTLLRYITLMAAFFPILLTLLKCVFLYRQQLLFRFFFYLLNRSKTLSFLRCPQFCEEKKVSGGQIRWIRWLGHNYGFVFSQNLTHKYRCMSWCVIMVQNSWLVFPQFCAFLTNCFAQSAHNFKAVNKETRTTLWIEFMIYHDIAFEGIRAKT